MNNDIFERIQKQNGPLGKFANYGEGYFLFPKLEGELGPKMQFNGKEVLNWSLNDYLGLANHPEVRKADADAAAQFGAAYPMGARMLSGHTKYHEQLEAELATFVSKQAAYLLNFGYQGMLSIVDTLVSKKDAIVYDSDVHACIIDGIRFKQKQQRFVFKHNNMLSAELKLQQATAFVKKTGGGVLFITEGVFGMQGQQGKLKDIVALKQKYNFRLLVDDAHGFGTLGSTGAGTGQAQNCQNEIDLYFSTFTKSMANAGAFVAANSDIINYLKYNLRSQIFAKSLPLIQTVGSLKRIELIKNNPELRTKLWKNVNALQSGLRKEGFNIGQTNSCITPVYINGDVRLGMVLVNDLRENHGVFLSLVVYPVVPKNVILLRIVPTASHSIPDIERTIVAFKTIKIKIVDGSYEKLSRKIIL